MSSSKNISGWQFAAFRIIFGAYLAWHFAALLPFGPELFSANGTLPSASLNLTYRAFPNLLAVADAPWEIRTFIALLFLAAIGLAAGWRRRSCALLLWYGWACLFNRNNLISNPGVPYVGLLLIFCALVPSGEPLSLERRADPEWRMPALVFWGAWFLLAAGYTYSGVWKLLSPSWQDGSALHHLLTNPLARPGVCRNVLLTLPPPILAVLGWLALAGELAALPLSLTRSGRLIAWTWMVVMHLGILSVVDFADLTLGMMMIHLFTFDPDWLRPRVAWQPLLLFDGECALCHRAVRFFSSQDTHEVLRYAPLQGRLGRAILSRHDLLRTDSMVLVENPSTPRERTFILSDAVLRTLTAIGGIWKLAGVASLAPKPVRDRVYSLLASRRYSWFGRVGNSCALPSPRLKRLVLEDSQPFG
jgi:predicted DCC family thiol-disulfide oxidoreductase YuxK